MRTLFFLAASLMISALMSRPTLAMGAKPLEKPAIVMPSAIESRIGSPITWGDFARDPSGHIRAVNFYDAQKYCAGLLMRLPTLRELVTLFTYYGEEGASETKYPNVSVDDPRVAAEIRGMAWPGKIAIEGYNADHTAKVVLFYVSNVGFETPTNIGRVDFWSSTPLAGTEITEFPSGWMLSGGNGGPLVENLSNAGFGAGDLAEAWDSINVVRCVADR